MNGPSGEIKMTSPLNKAAQWPVVSTVGVVMIFTWDSTYYLLAVLAEPIASDTGWGIASVTGALTIGLFIAGLASPKIGRRIHNGSGRSILAFGCILICIGLCTIGTAQDIWMFWFGWMVLGFGMAAGLYDPVFATLGRLYENDACRAITLVTLTGGFSSTIFWPLSAFMLETWAGWRGAVFRYVIIHAFITFPFIMFLIPKSQHESRESDNRLTYSERALTVYERQTLFAFATIQVLHGFIVVNISVLIFTYPQA